MTLQFDAVYQDGVLRPAQPIVLPNGTKVRVAIEMPETVDDPLAEVLGIGDGPPTGNLAELHDEYLYGERQS